MRVTSKGQVTIPRDLRETFGIAANSEVIFGIEGGKITIVPKDDIGRLADRERLDRFLAVLDRLEVDRLAVVGISATAMTAIRLAAEQPGRVSHLITAGGWVIRVTSTSRSGSTLMK